jgi:hypothetical protein
MGLLLPGATMIGRTVVAAATLLAIMLAGTGTAGAKVNIIIGVGGYGDSYHISCSQGARIVYRAGYDYVRAIDCAGSYYSYRGDRAFRRYIIKVKSKNGTIVDVVRVH